MDSLPNEIICHIGSFLSAKEAVFVMVLSKRWRNLFTIIPKLDFRGNEASFEGFVDGVLALPVNTRIRTFSLIWYHSKYDHINRCLSDVSKRGVLDLKLRIQGGKQEGYSLPLEVFTCRTVAKMELGFGFAIDLLPPDAFLPSLKSLFLKSVRFYDFGGRCAFNTLLSASPVLEELVIDYIELERWKWSGIVSSPTLQRLIIRRRDWRRNNEGIGLDCLDTPSLTYLEYSEYVPKKYLIVNLNSLVEAKLDLRVEEEGVWCKPYRKYFDPRNLIDELKNVEVLELTHDTAQMFHVFGEAVPVFEKLFQISLSLGDSCCYSLPNLIKKSPNLKTLIIEGSLHYGRRDDEYICECVSGYSFLLSCPVEILKIYVYQGTDKELEQMKHFLEKLSCLQLVEIHAQVSEDSEDKMLQIESDLLMIPTASTKYCEIEIEFSLKDW